MAGDREIGEIQGLIQGLAGSIGRVEASQGKIFEKLELQGITLATQAQNISANHAETKLISEQRTKMVSICEGLLGEHEKQRNFATGLQDDIKKMNSSYERKIDEITKDLQHLREQGCNRAAMHGIRPDDADNPPIFTLIRRGTIEGIKWSVVVVTILFLGKAAGIFSTVVKDSKIQTPPAAAGGLAK